ncbi:MAG: beta-agarase [Verrucomicrobiota bacterium]
MIRCLVALAAGLTGPLVADPVRIMIEPGLTRSIEGESTLERERYFAISDNGASFERRVGSDDRYKVLTEDLNIRFGRFLGPVKFIASQRMREDPERPGYVDLAHLEKILSSGRQPVSERMKRDFGSNLDVAAHDSHNAFPPFMGTWTTDWIREHADAKKGGHQPDLLPGNPDAAAEATAVILEHAFNELHRPRYYEPVNEPHWSYLLEPEKIAEWHLKTHQAVKRRTPEVLVGGPCNSVGYFYSKGYQSFRGIKNFIAATKAQLDFHSFHVYDYYRWNGKAFEGAILSGLPLEGVLDLVSNHTLIAHGTTKPLVISEHGGYASIDKTEDGTPLVEAIAAEHFPGKGFDWQMKARSIHDFLHVNSIIANTLVFMEHPHTVKKAVPFILLDTTAWDPHYYAALYTRRNFDRSSNEWAASKLDHFYRLFSEVEGRRVATSCSDPDIQLRAFVNANELHIIAHNLSEKPEQLALQIPQSSSLRLKRYGRNPDLTPFLLETEPSTLAGLQLGASETIVLKAGFAEALKEENRIRETAHYGDAVTVPVEKAATIGILVPDPTGIDSATLRVGFNRPFNAGREITIRLNGHPLDDTVEDSADVYSHETHGYSSTRLIELDPATIEARNELEISFPDGLKGTIGSVVIRTCVRD